MILLWSGRQVLGFGAALPAALCPFAGSGGTAGGFVTGPGEEIGDSTLEWVGGCVPAGRPGPGRCTARIVVGFAALGDFGVIGAGPFGEFTVRGAAVAVYRPGTAGPPAGSCGRPRTGRTSLRVRLPAWDFPVAGACGVRPRPCRPGTARAGNRPGRGPRVPCSVRV